MKNYILFIGGSGARVCKAFLHCAATGAISTKEVNVMLIDADRANAAGTECCEIYRNYSSIQEMFNSSSSNIDNHGLFSCKVDMRNEILSPVRSDSINLSAEVGTEREKTRVLNWFYTEEEIHQSLEKGFYAHPNIGCVFFSDFKSKIFDDCMEDICRAINDKIDVNFVLVGSLFGGTGASGIPTLLKMAREVLNSKFENAKEFLKFFHCSGIFLTPYFKVLGKKEKEDNGISIDPETFYFNTYEALKYYNAEQYDKRKNDEISFQSIYLVGQQELDIVNSKYADGGNDQCNKPHIVELYATLAIDKFLQSSLKDEEHGVFGYVREGGLNWNSFPQYGTTDDKKIVRIADFVRLQAVYWAEVNGYLYKKDRNSKLVSAMEPQWYKRFNIKEMENNRDVINKDFKSFMDWIYGIQTIISESGIIYDSNMHLFGENVIHVRNLADKLQSKSRETDIKNTIKKITEGFNTIIDTTANIDYVIQKIVKILSLAGVVPKNLVIDGIIGLIAVIFGFVSEKERK